MYSDRKSGWDCFNYFERVQNRFRYFKIKYKNRSGQKLFTETDDKWIDTDSPPWNSLQTILSFGLLKEM